MQLVIEIKIYVENELTPTAHKILHFFEISKTDLKFLKFQQKSDIP